MNTTELIEVAIECGGFLHEYKPTVVCFYAHELQQFAQRIEQPHKQRIAELEQELHYAKQAARAEADMYDQARAAMKRLREALQTAKAMGFFSPTMESSVTHRDLCKSVDKILEQTK